MKPVSPENIRATNEDRQATADRLWRAHSEGAITLAEFDSRVRIAWMATRRGELAELTADLPIERPRTVPPPDYCRHRGGWYAVLRAVTTAWLTASAISIVMWLLLGAAEGELQRPWWVWIVGPAGGVLAVLWFAVTCGHERESRHRPP